MEFDQHKYNLLLRISDLIDETLLDLTNTSDIELPSDVVTKGRPKNTKYGRIPSKFEIEESKIIKKAKNQEERPLEFFVHSNIPRENTKECVNIKSDEFCGYRTIAYYTEGSQDAYMEVKKKMLNYFRVNKSIYEEHYRYMQFKLSNIEEALIYRLERNDITKKSDSDELTYEPLMYVPFQGPLLNDREPIPIIMQSLNKNHWATIKSKGRIIRIDWPIIDGYCIKAYTSMDHTTNLRKSISWRYLSIKKRDDEKTAHNDDPVVFD
ncbi:hypothetical protein BDC45DRAFT_539051 [Circinella umbellata]|nr:hypothetical protein BDC45DRAFT_539051 [Circinella umbellata]